MEDKACVSFLQWALPRLHMRWKGFRKVRRQVCRRVDKRMAELGLGSIQSYQEYLQENPDEWNILDGFCQITISRFYRNRPVFEYFANDVLPELIRNVQSQGCNAIRIWSAGCASGEEPYSVALLWHFLIKPLFQNVSLEILATDSNPVMTGRALRGCYEMSSLRNLPVEWIEKAFDKQEELFCLQMRFKKYVNFAVSDIRDTSPGEKFHVVLCRNLAFTYFDVEIQKQFVQTLYKCIETNGVLIVGTHEKVPGNIDGFSQWIEHLPIYRKV